jgi:hypothetical protein
MITKVEAIEDIMRDNEGTATLQEIYNRIGSYYHNLNHNTDWQAGLRGVLYREIRNGHTFKKIDKATYALI